MLNTLFLILFQLFPAFIDIHSEARKSFSLTDAQSLNGEVRMFRRRREIRQRLLEFIEKFRMKGALSPENSMTAEELGLPAEFKERMNKRLGKLGFFVEINGKFYLSEERLKEVMDKIAERRRTSNW